MANRPADEFDVTAYGAAGDGETDDTDAIQSALDDCAATGGIVQLPPGEYMTDPLAVGDDTTLRVESGARLAFTRDFAAFPTVESRWEGWDQHGFHPCLRVHDAANVRIEGGGTIDGNGSYWWELVGLEPADWPDGLRERLDEMHELNDKADEVSTFTLRPPLLQLHGAENVTVTGVTLTNSPFWNTHVVYCEDVTLHDLRIENPPDAPNGDGIDVDSSTHVRISDCFIDAGDDAICLKSGKNAEGRRAGRPCAQIAVTNCTIESGHGGVVIGSEMSGDVRDVAVTNCTFTGTDRGIRIKTQRDRGGVVEDCRFDTILMRDVVCPFTINGYYFTDIDAEPEPVGDGTPEVRDVTFQHITARNVASAAFLAGLPELHFSNITFDDVTIEATRAFDPDDPDPSMAYNYESTHGIFGKSLGELSFRDVRIKTREGPALDLAEVDDVSIDGLTIEAGQSTPGIVLRDVGETRIRGARVPDELGTAVRVEGEDAGPVSFRDGDELTERVDVTGADDLDLVESR